MKKVLRVPGIAALMLMLAVVMGVSLIGCENVASVPAGSLPALTGTVSISGAAQVGETLTANTNNLFGSGAIFFQWQRLPPVGDAWVDIAGATASTRTLQTADSGHVIRVMVTRSGNSGSVTSAPTVVQPLFTDIAWTATAASGTPTPSITLAFNAAPMGLVVADITVASGTGSATRGNLTGTGNTRTLTLTGVTAGTVYISIDRAGITSGPEQVALVGPITITVPAGGTVANQLSWIRGLGQSGNHFIIQASGNETISAAEAELPANINITIIGTTHSSINGTFTVPSGATLTLDANITITGSGNRGVTVNNGSTLIMNAGSAITGNSVTGANAQGGGVLVNSGGTLIMNAGSAITGNSVTGAGAQGGGVLVNSGGTLIMNAGSRIAGNTVSYNVAGTVIVTVGGGGVRINSGGTFTMNGGEISGNTATATRTGGQPWQNPTSQSQGGGVFVGGTFTMNGGEISGNTVAANHTGDSGGTMLSEGGGVFVSSGSTFAMRGGEISGNTVTSLGLVGTLTSRGGGVRVASPAGIFRISGGIVRGNEAALAAALRNTSGDGLSASLSNAGTAQFGTWVGNNFTSRGTLGTTIHTINVVNGNLP